MRPPGAHNARMQERADDARNEEERSTPPAEVGDGLPDGAPPDVSDLGSYDAPQETEDRRPNIPGELGAVADVGLGSRFRRRRSSRKAGSSEEASPAEADDEAEPVPWFPSSAKRHAGPTAPAVEPNEKQDDDDDPVPKGRRAQRSDRLKRSKRRDRENRAEPDEPADGNDASAEPAEIREKTPRVGKRPRRRGRHSRSESSDHTGDSTEPPPDAETLTRPSPRKARRAERKERSAQHAATIRRRRVSRAQHKASAAPKLQHFAKNDADGGDKTRRRKADASKKKAPKLSKAARKTEKQRLADEASRKPPKGKARVAVVDGRYVTLASFHNGRLASIGEHDYPTKEIAAATAARLKTRYVIWANGAVTKSIAKKVSPASSELEQASALHSAFKATMPRSVVVAKAEGIAIPSAWSDSRVFRSGKRGVVLSGLAHGTNPGVWLRVGHEITEITLVDGDGNARAWEMLPFREPSDEVSSSISSGIQGLSERVQAGADLHEEIRSFAQDIATFVSDQVQDWAGISVVEHNVYLHGPGIRIPGLFDAIRARNPQMRVREPTLDVDEGVVERDQMHTVLNVWGRPAVSDPQAVLRRHRHALTRKRTRKVLYVCMAVAAVVSFSLWRGSKHQASLDAANQRAEAANAEVSSLSAQAPPAEDFTLIGARRWLSCETEAADVAAAGETVVAVPAHYDPSIWPESWAAILTEIPDFDKHVGLAVFEGNDTLSLLDDNLSAARDIAASELSEPINSDQIDEVFMVAGLDPDLWRVFVWGISSFVGREQQFVPPRTHHLCAATGPDLLWVAQNSPLLSGLVARQLQESSSPTSDGAGSEWLMAEMPHGGAVPLRQAHTSISAEITVFSAWLADDKAIVDALRPLAVVLWGTDGDVLLTDAPSRQCRTGIDVISGAKTQKCGTTLTVTLGPRHLISVDDFPLLEKDEGADE